MTLRLTSTSRSKISGHLERLTLRGDILRKFNVRF
jgi:hypothetical protein